MFFFFEKKGVFFFVFFDAFRMILQQKFSSKKSRRAAINVRMNRFRVRNDRRSAGGSKAPEGQTRRQERLDSCRLIWPRILHDA